MTNTPYKADKKSIHFSGNQSKFHSLCNITKTFHILDKSGIDRTNINALDVVKGREDIIMGLVWHIIDHFDPRSGNIPGSPFNSPIKSGVSFTSSWRNPDFVNWKPVITVDQDSRVTVNTKSQVSDIISPNPFGRLKTDWMRWNPSLATDSSHILSSDLIVVKKNVHNTRQTEEARESSRKDKTLTATSSSSMTVTTKESFLSIDNNSCYSRPRSKTTEDMERVKIVPHDPGLPTIITSRSSSEGRLDLMQDDEERDMRGFMSRSLTPGRESTTKGLRKRLHRKLLPNWLWFWRRRDKKNKNPLEKNDTTKQTEETINASSHEGNVDTRPTSHLIPTALGHSVAVVEVPTADLPETVVTSFGTQTSFSDVLNQNLSKADKETQDNLMDSPTQQNKLVSIGNKTAYNKLNSLDGQSVGSFDEDNDVASVQIECEGAPIDGIFYSNDKPVVETIFSSTQKDFPSEKNFTIEVKPERRKQNPTVVEFQETTRNLHCTEEEPKDKSRKQKELSTESDVITKIKTEKEAKKTKHRVEIKVDDSHPMKPLLVNQVHRRNLKKKKEKKKQTKSHTESEQCHLTKEKLSASVIEERTTLEKTSKESVTPEIKTYEPPFDDMKTEEKPSEEVIHFVDPKTKSDENEVDEVETDSKARETIPEDTSHASFQASTFINTNVVANSTNNFASLIENKETHDFMNSSCQQSRLSNENKTSSKDLESLGGKFVQMSFDKYDDLKQLHIVYEEPIEIVLHSNDKPVDGSIFCSKQDLLSKEDNVKDFMLESVQTPTIESQGKTHASNSVQEEIKCKNETYTKKKKSSTALEVLTETETDNRDDRRRHNVERSIDYLQNQNQTRNKNRKKPETTGDEKPEDYNPGEKKEQSVPVIVKPRDFKETGNEGENGADKPANNITKTEGESLEKAVAPVYPKTTSDETETEVWDSIQPLLSCDKGSLSEEQQCLIQEYVQKDFNDGEWIGGGTLVSSSILSINQREEDDFGNEEQTATVFKPQQITLDLQSTREEPENCRDKRPEKEKAETESHVFIGTKFEHEDNKQNHGVNHNDTERDVKLHESKLLIETSLPVINESGSIDESTTESQTGENATDDTIVEMQSSEQIVVVVENQAECDDEDNAIERETVHRVARVKRNADSSLMSIGSEENVSCDSLTVESTPTCNECSPHEEQNQNEYNQRDFNDEESVSSSGVTHVWSSISSDNHHEDHDFETSFMEMSSEGTQTDKPMFQDSFSQCNMNKTDENENELTGQTEVNQQSGRSWKSMTQRIIRASLPLQGLLFTALAFACLVPAWEIPGSCIFFNSLDWDLVLEYSHPPPV